MNLGKSFRNNTFHEYAVSENLEYNDMKDACEIGWTVHENYRNKGIATEAAKLLMEYASNNLLIHKVTSCCDLADSESEKVMVKMDMTLC